MATLKFGTLGAARITPRALVQPVAADPELGRAGSGLYAGTQ